MADFKVGRISPPCDPDLFASLSNHSFSTSFSTDKRKYFNPERSTLSRTKKCNPSKIWKWAGYPLQEKHIGLRGLVTLRCHWEGLFLSCHRGAFPLSLRKPFLSCHCEERSDEAISFLPRDPLRLLRFARNDGIGGLLRSQRKNFTPEGSLGTFGLLRPTNQDRIPYAFRTRARAWLNSAVRKGLVM